MNQYKVTYTGNSSRFKDFEDIVLAESERKAVEQVYSERCSHAYFPQDDGTILDADGYIIASLGDQHIKYDGGYFEATEVERY